MDAYIATWIKAQCGCLDLQEMQKRPFNKKASSAAVIYRMSLILESTCLKQHAECFSIVKFHMIPSGTFLYMVHITSDNKKRLCLEWFLMLVTNMSQW